ncbi:MAG: ATP synthase F1 subunit delta [Nitrospirota bacterium]
MRQKKESRKYAKTLLDIIGIEDAPVAIKELNAISDLMTRSKEFKDLFLSPLFTSEEKERVLRQIATKGKLSDKTVRFALYLSESGVINMLPEILRIATSLYMERKQRIKAVVMTPIKIDKDYESRLKEALKAMTDSREVDVVVAIEPSLLGGVLIKVGSTMYDSSLKGQLRLLKDELIKG